MTFISSSFYSLEQNNKIGRKQLYKNKKQHNQTSGILRNPKIIQTKKEKVASRAKVQQEIKAEQKKIRLKFLIAILICMPILLLIAKGIESFLRNLEFITF